MGNATCVIDDCSRTPRTRGYCTRHYANLINYGYPIPQRDWPLGERLQKIGWTVTESGCWEWNGSRNDCGYGLFTSKRLGYKNARAHRVVYEHLVGPIPEGLELRHHCDNPPCVNPEHVEPGTHAENMADILERGRAWHQNRTKCPNGHDLTLPGATKIVRRKRGDETACVQCARARSLRYARKTRAALVALGDL